MQSKILRHYLNEQKIKYRYYDFPRYYGSWYGSIVARFLRGEFGKLHDISPYLSSIPFTQDRSLVAQEMRNWLMEGNHLICNRYTTSSIAHQGAKFKNKSETHKFIKWLRMLEYQINDIPREDAVIYLNVPVNTILRLINKRKIKKYLHGKKSDIEEQDALYLSSVENIFFSLSKNNPHWHLINCAPKGKLLSINAISDKVIKIVREILNK